MLSNRNGCQQTESKRQKYQDLCRNTNDCEYNSKTVTAEMPATVTAEMPATAKIKPNFVILFIFLETAKLLPSPNKTNDVHDTSRGVFGTDTTVQI